MGQYKVFWPPFLLPHSIPALTPLYTFYLTPLPPLLCHSVTDTKMTATTGNMLSCQTYTVPQSSYVGVTDTTNSAYGIGKAIPLRSGLGLTVTGEIIYAAMDAGFTLGVSGHAQQQQQQQQSPPQVLEQVPGFARTS